MGEGESIYKLVGPVLLKQDKTEAESTVNGRLEFINKEMYVAFFCLFYILATAANTSLFLGKVRE